jgi:hypothetical protein
LLCFCASSDLSVVVDSVDRINIDKGRIYSQGWHGFVKLQNAIQVYPSFLISVDDDGQAIEGNPRMSEIISSLRRLHPYCQQILYSSPKLIEYLSAYASTPKKKIVEPHSDSSEALVHVVSFRVRTVNVYVADNRSDVGVNVHAEIEDLLRFEISQIFNSLSILIPDSEREVDKSLLLKVVFKYVTNHDLSLEIDSITPISISTIHAIREFDNILKSMLDNMLKFKRRIHAEIGSNNSNYVRACEELGVCCEPIGRNMYYLSQSDSRAVYVPYHRTLQSAESINIASSKQQTSVLLSKNGFHVNRHMHMNLEEFRRLIDSLPDDPSNTQFAKLNTPLVVKPTDKSAGYGVFLSISSKQQLIKVSSELSSLGDVSDLIIEEQFDGALYRFIVIGSEVSAVLKATYPELIGNGVSTVKQLIAEYNRHNSRKIRIDGSLMIHLESIGLELATVIQVGRRVCVSLKKNGDVTHNVTEIISDKYKIIAIEVAKALGLKVSGVDMMISEGGDYRIIEVNTAPALYPHRSPNYGRPIDLFKAVILYLINNVDKDLYGVGDIYLYHS